MATVILIGNEKGGAGKTTMAIHITTALLYLGFKVSSIDLDIRQGSLSKYLENRKHSIANLQLKIPSPKFCKLEPSRRLNTNEVYADEEKQLNKILAQEHPNSDFIVVDTPGVNNPLSTLAHSFADIIITPINDSFLDISVLADVDPTDFNIIKPGVYSQIIWEQKINRAKRDGSHINWIITRNRIHSLDSNNQRNIEKVIGALSKRMGCKIAAGFGERVIFKELFLKGLTLLDLKEQPTTIQFTPSHIAAKQELISLLHIMNNESITSALAEKVL
jgi:chromosome partitioning protein